MAHMATTAGSTDARTLFAVMATLWAVAASYLLLARLVPIAASLVVALVLGEYVVREDVSSNALALLFWIGVIVVATQGAPQERSLLLRTCVTVVYAFTALSKINPSWLAGEGLIVISETRPHMEALSGLFAGPSGVTLAVIVVAYEVCLALGLWFERTRKATAAAGIIFHAVLVASANLTIVSLSHLVVLNFGLVAMYPAFWHPVHRNAVDCTHAQPHPGS